MPETVFGPVPRRRNVRNSLIAAGLFGLALLLVFYQTTWSMVSIWLRSETFAHGFLILPIVLWLVWDRRAQLALVAPSPAPLVALLLLLPGCVWLLAWLVDVLVVQQLALVAMLVTGAWAILGHKLARPLAFPLLFLFFAVPMGEGLVPPMMQLTANSTVALIRFTGIPVYHEGLFFTLPSGSWSVVAACSGVRYLIASVTLGVLYAYLTYQSLWRRALFVLASAVVPVFANTLRAYIIVMLGHMSDMKVATGVDHLIYGWLFFGLVMLLLFWLGSFFREEARAVPVAHPVPVTESTGTGTAPTRLLGTSLLVLCLVAIWPLLAMFVEARPVDSRGAINPPQPLGEWRAVPQAGWSWQPANTAGGQASGFYARADQTVGLYIHYEQGAGEDVVGSVGRFAPRGGAWRVVAREKASARLHGKQVSVYQARLSRGEEQMLAWSWYRIGGFYTSNDYLAKFYEAWVRLGFGAPATYRIVLTQPVQNGGDPGTDVLQGFLDAHLDALEQSLDYPAIEGAK